MRKKIKMLADKNLDIDAVRSELFAAGARKVHVSVRRGGVSIEVKGISKKTFADITSRIGVDVKKQVRHTGQRRSP